MPEGVLKNQSQSFNVDIEVDDVTEKKLTETSDGDVNEIEVTIIRGHTGNSDIYVSKEFDDCEISSMSHDVEIISELPQNRIVKSGAKLKVRLTTRVENGDSAIYQD